MKDETFKRIIIDPENVRVLIEGLSTIDVIQTKMLGKLITDDQKLPDEFAVYMKEIIAIDEVILQLMNHLGIAWGDMIISEMNPEVDLSKLKSNIVH
jgi:hypothetical protein